MTRDTAPGTAAHGAEGKEHKVHHADHEHELEISSGGLVRSVIRSTVERLSRSSRGFKIPRKMPRVKEIRVPKPRAVAHSAEHLKEILEFNESYQHTVSHGHDHKHGSDSKHKTVSGQNETVVSAQVRRETQPIQRNEFANSAALQEGSRVQTSSKTHVSKTRYYIQLARQVGPAFMKTSLLCTVLYSTYENAHELRHISTFEPFSEDSDEHFLVHTSLADATLWASGCGIAAGAATSLVSSSWDAIAKRWTEVKFRFNQMRSTGNISMMAEQSHSTIRRIAWSGSLAYHCTVSCLLFALYEPIKTLLMQSNAYQATVDFSYSRLRAVLHPSAAGEHHHVNLHRAAHFIADFGCILAAGSAAGILSDIVGYYLAPLEHIKLLPDKAVVFSERRDQKLSNGSSHTPVSKPLTNGSLTRGISLDPLKAFRTHKPSSVVGEAPMPVVAPFIETAAGTSAVTNPVGTVASLRDLFRAMRYMPAPTFSNILLTSVPHCVAFFAYEYGKSHAGGHR